jgi:hypothetical protein
MRVSFDRHEMRRDRRYPMPQLHLMIEGAEYLVTNWSLGGFLIAGVGAALEVGLVVTGTMRFADTKWAPFRAEVVRFEAETGLLAARFQELSDSAFDLLDRALVRKIGRRG